VSALVVGDGPERPALRVLAHELRVDAVFTGEAMDVPGLLSAMDLLVAPSAEETFGLGVLEGLAAGLPVRYVACPALDDLPAGSVPGARRVPAGTDALQRAVAATVQDGPYRLPPPPALDRYDITDVAARTDAVYQRVSKEESWLAQPRS
jgi:glycosyltransferase involved in cell wall biosynthesis